MDYFCILNSEGPAAQACCEADNSIRIRDVNGCLNNSKFILLLLNDLLLDVWYVWFNTLVSVAATTFHSSSNGSGVDAHRFSCLSPHLAHVARIGLHKRHIFSLCTCGWHLWRETKQAERNSVPGALNRPRLDEGSSSVLLPTSALRLDLRISHGCSSLTRDSSICLQSCFTAGELKGAGQLCRSKEQLSICGASLQPHTLLFTRHISVVTLTLCWPCR